MSVRGVRPRVQGRKLLALASLGTFALACRACLGRSPGFLLLPQRLQALQEGPETGFATGAPRGFRLHRGPPSADCLEPPGRGRSTAVRYNRDYYLEETYRSIKSTLRQLAKPLAALAVASSLLLGPLLHAAVPHECHAHHFNLLAWMAEPGRPDPVFGHLCLYSNVFFACLGPVLWVKRWYLELGMACLVGLASTVYHGLQVHPGFGPFHACTQAACVADICMATSFAAVLFARHPKTRRRGLPTIVVAMACFLAPSFLPESMTLVAYSWLHSAWHLFAAVSAYRIVAPGRAPASFGLATRVTAACSRLPRVLPQLARL